MPNLSIKNVPEHIVEKLRARTASHHRSLQVELRDLICRSTDEDAGEAPSDKAIQLDGYQYKRLPLILQHPREGHHRLSRLR